MGLFFGTGFEQELRVEVDNFRGFSSKGLDLPPSSTHHQVLVEKSSKE